MSTQLDLLHPPKDDVLDLIAGDHLHANDRAAVIHAIRTSVRPDGLVSANDWRPHMPTWVYHRVVGATVHALIKHGVLEVTGRWEPSTDTKGRNNGKPTRVYRLHPGAAQ